MILSRQELEDREEKMLMPYAVLSKYSRGRKHEEFDDKQRLAFQKDRDRIIHSRAFRRLKDKTQVFVASHGDHYRNRLTHSMEVSQVSRDIARTLGLNEDLAESIALAHDLGHPPFGHSGEFALSECMQEFELHFEHNEQSRRIVEELENIYPDYKGLNLSLEVIEGMMKHQTFWDNPKNESAIRPSLEAQIVNLADEIAYQNHDVDDGLRSGMFTEEDLNELALWQMATELIEKQFGPIEDPKIRFSRKISKMVGIMIADISVESTERLEENKIKTLEDVYNCENKLICFSREMASANRSLRDFLMTRFYNHPDVVAKMEEGQDILKKLFRHYYEKPEALPRILAEKAQALEGKERAELLRDYLSGMTDRFALLQFEHLEA